MAITPLKRAAFAFGGLDEMSRFLRGLHLHDREALAEAARAHLGTKTVTVTLRPMSDGAAVRALAERIGGRELCE